MFLFKLCHRKIKIPQSNKFNVKERKLNLRIYWRWLNFELWPPGQCEMVKLKKWLLVNIVYWPVMLEWFHSGIVCWSINIVGAAVFFSIISALSCVSKDFHINNCVHLSTMKRDSLHFISCWNFYFWFFYSL